MYRKLKGQVKKKFDVAGVANYLPMGYEQGSAWRKELFRGGKIKSEP
jgi:hypothetical protein